MFHLDLSTVLLLNVTVLLAGSGAFFHLRRLGVKPAALDWLGLGYGAQALGAGFAAFGEQGSLPAWLWESASLWLGIMGFALIWAGLNRLSRRRSKVVEWIALVAPFLCLLLAAATGGLGWNEQRATIFHLAGFAFLIAAAIEIDTRKKSEPLRSRRSLALLLVVFAFSFLGGLTALLSGVFLPQSLAIAFALQILCYFAVALLVSGFLTERIALDLRRLAEHDPLTGLGNRARLDNLLLAAPNRHMATIMVDLDHFKEINDRHGHIAGDRVLTAVADVLAAELGEDDYCIRYGGEEFLIVVKDRDPRQLAERLRARIAAAGVDIGQAEPIDITASFGVAVQRGRPCGWQELIKMADRALYEAKTAGRNRVVVLDAIEGTTIASPA